MPTLEAAAAMGLAAAVAAAIHAWSTPPRTPVETVDGFATALQPAVDAVAPSSAATDQHAQTADPVHQLSAAVTGMAAHLYWPGMAPFHVIDGEATVTQPDGTCDVMSVSLD